MAGSRTVVAGKLLAAAGIVIGVVALWVEFVGSAKYADDGSLLAYLLFLEIGSAVLLVWSFADDRAPLVLGFTALGAVMWGVHLSWIADFHTLDALDQAKAGSWLGVTGGGLIVVGGVVAYIGAWSPAPRRGLGSTNLPALLARLVAVLGVLLVFVSSLREPSTTGFFAGLWDLFPGHSFEVAIVILAALCGLALLSGLVPGLEPTDGAAALLALLLFGYLSRIPVLVGDLTDNVFVGDPTGNRLGLLGAALAAAGAVTAVIVEARLTRPVSAAARTLSELGAWARLGLVAALGLGVIAALSGVAEFILLGSEDVTETGLGATDNREQVIGVLQLVVYAVAGAAFIAWLYRAYRSLVSLGIAGLRFGRGWAIGSWFVPILNLFRPKQIVNDVWRGSDPDLPAAAGEEWKGSRVPVLFGWWWATFLISSWLYSTAAARTRAAEELAELQGATGIYVVADVLSIVAAALAIKVVGRTTARHEARAEKLAG